MRVALKAQPENRAAMELTLEGAPAPLTEPELAELRQLFDDVSLTRTSETTTLIIANQI